MIQKIIISNSNNIAAIVKHNKIQELVVIQNTYQVNDIYLGIVQKIFTSINAAFIQLNYFDRSGFIHANDMRNYHVLNKLYDISDNVKVQQKILVQIIKEPTFNKGPRLTTNIHLSGQYLILMPFNNTLYIAEKICNEKERAFLHALGILIKPATMGILFKESSELIEEQVLIEELRNLKKQWEFIQKAIIAENSPALLYKDNDLVRNIVRNYYNKDVKQIVVDSKDNAKKLYELIKPSHSQSYQTFLALYKKKSCLLEKFDITGIISKALNPKIELDSGIGIFIEFSEALTIIDVNSGSFNQAKSSKDTILRANCLAATEIAYQLQLRNISGMIIIDFIDMKSQKDKLTLLQHLHTALKEDGAKPEIIQLSELGLVELTRRRRGKSLLEIFLTSNEYNRTNHIFTLSQAEIVQSGKDKHLNINSIFFKKKFKAKLNLYWDYNIQTLRLNNISFIPLIYSNIIPLELYSSLLETIVLL